ncbi:MULTISPECIES: recombinase family protein [unclassified Streptomyces]|uniref:recombinase family protein n=1 Tax=unclassified Streptomyces TaxID=2593676 RepID=UPI003BB53577
MPIAPEYLHLVFPDQDFPALLYGRNSVGRGARSVQDQLDSGQELCDRHGWPVIDVFEDRGISASRHARKKRDDFEDLLESIESGAARIVVAYEASRYYRDLEAYVRLRNACHNAGVLLCYNGTVYDLSKKEDRKSTAMDAIAAEEEADDTQQRNLRTTLATAEAGGPHGKLPFGYLRDYELIDGRARVARQYEDPQRGHFIVEGLRRIDSGKSLNSVVNWLRKTKEAERPDGAEWTDHTVKRMLLNRVYLGERLHLGTSHKAIWAPLKGLDTPEGVAMFNRVTKILTDPSRGGVYDTRAAHLLSRIGLCGECDTPDAVFKPGKRARNGARLYVCRNLDTSILEEYLDAFVIQAVLTWLRDKETARAVLIPDPAVEAEELETTRNLLTVFTEELAEARSMAKQRTPDGRPLLSLASLSEKELDLLPKIEELETKLKAATGASDLARRLVEAKDPAEVWDGVPASEDAPAVPGLTLEQRRQAIRLIVTVRLYKTTKPGKKIDPDRIRLSFRGEPGFVDRPLRARGPRKAPARPGRAASGTL